MSYFIEVDSYDNGKIILNIESISQILPSHNGTIVHMNNKTLRVKETYDYFKQYCLVPVTQEQIEDKINKINVPKSAKEKIDVPALLGSKKESKETSE